MLLEKPESKLSAVLDDNIVGDVECYYTCAGEYFGILDGSQGFV